MTVAVVALAILVGATLQSATGFGFALITAPVLFAVFTPGEALTIMLLLAPVLSVLLLFSERRGVEVLWPDVTRLIAWTVPGLVLGVLVLRAVDKPVLQVAVGLAVISAALVDLRRASLARVSRPWPAAPVGVVSGTLSTTVGVSGPPLVMYLLRSEADPHQTRDSLAAIFLLTAPVSGAVLAAGGELGFGDVGVPELAGWVALVALGRPLGRWLFLRMDAQRFRSVALGLAVLAGLGSVAAGLA